MKNNINYKILALVPFFGVLANSCSRTKANIFMGTTPNMDTVLLRDIITGEERLFISTSLKDVLPYFHTGDTVYLCNDNRIKYDWYNNNRLLDLNDCRFEYNENKIKNRKIQEKKTQQQSVIEQAKKSINQTQR